MTTEVPVDKSEILRKEDSLLKTPSIIDEKTSEVTSSQDGVVVTGESEKKPEDDAPIVKESTFKKVLGKFNNIYVYMLFPLIVYLLYKAILTYALVSVDYAGLHFFALRHEEDSDLVLMRYDVRDIDLTQMGTEHENWFYKLFQPHVIKEKPKNRKRSYYVDDTPDTVRLGKYDHFNVTNDPQKNLLEQVLLARYRFIKFSSLSSPATSKDFNQLKPNDNEDEKVKEVVQFTHLSKDSRNSYFEMLSESEGCEKFFIEMSNIYLAIFNQFKTFNESQKNDSTYQPELFISKDEKTGKMVMSAGLSTLVENLIKSIPNVENLVCSKFNKDELDKGKPLEIAYFTNFVNALSEAWTNPIQTKILDYLYYYNLFYTTDESVQKLKDTDPECKRLKDEADAKDCPKSVVDSLNADIKRRAALCVHRSFSIVLSHLFVHPGNKKCLFPFIAQNDSRSFLLKFGGIQSSSMKKEEVDFLTNWLIENSSSN